MINSVFAPTPHGTTPERSKGGGWRQKAVVLARALSARRAFAQLSASAQQAASTSPMQPLSSQEAADASAAGSGTANPARRLTAIHVPSLAAAAGSFVDGGGAGGAFGSHAPVASSSDTGALRHSQLFLTPTSEDIGCSGPDLEPFPAHFCTAGGYSAGWYSSSQPSRWASSVMQHIIHSVVASKYQSQRTLSEVTGSGPVSGWLDDMGTYYECTDRTETLPMLDPGSHCMAPASQPDPLEHKAHHQIAAAHDSIARGLTSSARLDAPNSQAAQQQGQAGVTQVQQQATEAGQQDAGGSNNDTELGLTPAEQSADMLPASPNLSMTLGQDVFIVKVWYLL